MVSVTDQLEWKKVFFFFVKNIERVNDLQLSCVISGVFLDQFITYQFQLYTAYYYQISWVMLMGAACFWDGKWEYNFEYHFWIC